MAADTLKNGVLTFGRRVIDQLFNSVSNKILNQRCHVIKLHTHLFYGNEGLWEVGLNLWAALLLGLFLGLLLLRLLGLLDGWGLSNLFICGVLTALVVLLPLLTLFLVGLFLHWHRFLLLEHFALELPHRDLVENELKLAPERRIIVQNIPPICTVIPQQPPPQHPIKYLHSLIKHWSFLSRSQIPHDVVPLLIKVLQQLPLSVLLHVL